MEKRFSISPNEAKTMDTQQLRSNFLVSNLMVPGELKLFYSFDDRMIIGGAVPQAKKLDLPCPEELRANYFLERREMGIINVGGPGKVMADGKEYLLEKQSCLYLGKGVKEVSFKSNSRKEPAIFYFLSSPAHRVCATRIMHKEEASPVSLGAAETGNARTIYKYIHLEGIESCQLVMGLTVIQTGSVWNSVPPHTHTRRMEVYFYFDLPEEQRLFHFMGDPSETRHLIMANNEAVISPPWSTHFGCGTSNYGFIWGMCGENLVYNDMDPAPVPTLL